MVPKVCTVARVKHVHSSETKRKNRMKMQTVFIHVCTIYRNILVQKFVIPVHASYDACAWTAEIPATRYHKNNVTISRIHKYNSVRCYILPTDRVNKLKFSPHELPVMFQISTTLENSIPTIIATMGVIFVLNENTCIL
jgi:hypothetical protein